jgi:hypothetical protein
MADPIPLRPLGGPELVEELLADLNQYVSMRPEYAAAVVFWALHTHLLDLTNFTPRLGITAPEKRCGKTTLIEWLETIVHKPMRSNNITPAAFFRVVDRDHPTLLVDEADSFLPDDKLRGVINSGHKRGAFEHRTGLRRGVEEFETFCPCAIALIGTLPETLHDRSITIAMQRCKPGERFESLELGKANPLKHNIRPWAQSARFNIKPALPEALYSRVADNWRPLLTIADAVGGVWPDRLRDVALWIENRLESIELSEGEQLLSDIRENFGTREPVLGDHARPGGANDQQDGRPETQEVRHRPRASPNRWCACSRLLARGFRGCLVEVRTGCTGSRTSRTRVAIRYNRYSCRGNMTDINEIKSEALKAAQEAADRQHKRHDLFRQVLLQLYEAMFAYRKIVELAEPEDRERFQVAAKLLEQHIDAFMKESGWREEYERQVAAQAALRYQQLMGKQP